MYVSCPYFMTHAAPMLLRIPRIFNSHDDIREVIRFYETSVGARVIRALPIIAREFMPTGQKRGEKIVQKVLQKLKEEGYK